MGETLKIEYTEKELEMLKKLSLTPTLNLKLDEAGFYYYKGFYDATHQFIQIFEKLIEAGAFSGTETNSHN